MLITSRQNGRIKEAVKLKTSSERKKSGLFTFEGLKLYNEAVGSGADILTAFVTEGCNIDTSAIPEVYTVTDEVYEKLTDDSSPDGCFFIAKIPENVNYNPDKISGRTFCAFSVRDPGNLGNIVRTAYAFGIDNLILSDCADPLSEKVIRASAGAIFKQNISVFASSAPALRLLDSAGYITCAAALCDNTVVPEEILGKEKNEKDRISFIVGNEGHGLDKEIIDNCRYTVKIPMESGSESLNASTAAAILMWELYR